MQRPPVVFRITGETALHWKDENGKNLLKGACSTTTYSRKKEAEQACSQSKKALVETSKNNKGYVRADEIGI